MTIKNEPFYNYSIINISEGDERGFKAVIPKFPNLHIVADTPQQLHKVIETAIKEEIMFYKKKGIKIPSPNNAFRDYSGKFILRIEPEIHQTLAELANAQGKSLNQLISNLIKNQIKSVVSA